jgi:DNA polymerase I
MDLRINDRIILQPGRFYAVIAPVEMITAGLNNNPSLDRFTTLLIGGNYSRLVNGFTRTSSNINVRRAFTVHSLMTILHENYHSIVILEHDSSMYEDAGEVKRVVPQAMKSVSHDAIFVLYSPTMDKHFAYLASAADHIIIYDNTCVPISTVFGNRLNNKRFSERPCNGQKTLF